MGYHPNLPDDQDLPGGEVHLDLDVGGTRQGLHRDEGPVVAAGAERRAPPVPGRTVGHPIRLAGLSVRLQPSDPPVREARGHALVPEGDHGPRVLAALDLHGGGSDEEEDPGRLDRLQDAAPAPFRLPGPCRRIPQERVPGLRERRRVPVRARDGGEAAGSAQALKTGLQGRPDFGVHDRLLRRRVGRDEPAEGLDRDQG
jgi:hypothetical protein